MSSAAGTGGAWGGCAGTSAYRSRSSRARAAWIAGAIRPANAVIIGAAGISWASGRTAAGHAGIHSA